MSKHIINSFSALNIVYRFKIGSVRFKKEESVKIVSSTLLLIKKY